MSRRALLFPIVLAVLTACQDATSPDAALRPQFAQGDGGVWTVNSLADPGDGTCDDTECTLREAIAAAAAGDSIRFADGLEGQIDLQAGQLEIQRNLSISGDGRITVSAGLLTRVISIDASLAEPDTVTLAGLKLTLGVASSTDGGGGIYAYAAVLTLDDVDLTANGTNASGGGLAASFSEITIRNSRIRENVAEIRGAGIHHTYGHLAIINSSIEGNATTFGDGAGISTDDGSTLLLVGSTVAENSASDAGGILIGDGATGRIERSTVSGNEATDQYGTAGITSEGGLELRSSTVTRNTGGGRGGLGNFGVMTVTNSIVAGNNGVMVDDCGGANGIGSGGYNLHGQDCGFSAPTDIEVLDSQVFTEVLEQELADNGGPTMTHALIPRGRAVDAGSCVAQTEDQRGFTRPIDDPTMPNAADACDIGAYELQGAVAPMADLMISQSVDKASVRQGDVLTYTIRVQNLGPQTAPTVVVNDVLSSGVTFVAIAYDKGHHTAPPAGETGTVTWYLGDMADQANEAAEIKVTVLVKGKTTITSTATVDGAVVDPNEANNTAAITVSVGSGGSSGGGRKPR